MRGIRKYESHFLVHDQFYCFNDNENVPYFNMSAKLERDVVMHCNSSNRFDK